MTISKYEAAVLYCWNERKIDSQYLVLDLDDCSYGFCKCNEQGQTQLLNSLTSINADLWKICVEAVKTAVDEDYPFDIAHELKSQLNKANEILYNYIISEEVLNVELFQFSNNVITCKEFESYIGEVKTKLDELFASVFMSNNEGRIADCNVIILGEAQDIVLVTHYIKTKLCGDPLLADKRFINSLFSVPYNEFVARGMSIFESKRLISKKYSLLLFNKETNLFEEIFSVTTGQELNNDTYSEPVLLTINDSFSFRINEKEMDVKIPFSFEPFDSDLVKVSLGMHDDKAELRIRRCRFPSQEYSVVL